MPTFEETIRKAKSRACSEAAEKSIRPKNQIEKTAR
jgi:hypothetical protein